MPTHLLSINIREAGGVHFKLINRTSLKPEHYVTEEMIASLSAQSPDLSREEVVKRLVTHKLRYAILSHRWSGEEATFEMVKLAGMGGLGTNAPPGYKKLETFCAMAVAHDCKLAWADTACIDKTSSAELDQAIRSMFNWYRNSAICIVYLACSQNLDDFEDDPWFRRGWTLQELLAPVQIKFYGKDWKLIRDIKDVPNDKDNDEIMQAISKTTGIKDYDIRHFSPGLFNVREKMVWASRRETTLVEDVAYSLLGIFDINIPIAYGEGKRAFRRLMEAIVQDCREWQIFAWAGHHSPYAIVFPESPSGYGPEFLGEVDASVLNPERPIHRPWDLGYPFYTMTKQGLEIRVLLVEVMLQIDRDQDPEAGRPYERLTLCPGSQDQRYFHDIEVVCDTRFLLYSQWAVGIISYQTDGNGEEDEMGELDGDTSYVCFLLGTGIYSPYGKWEKVGTRKVLSIRTKEVVRRKLMTLWL